MSEKLYAASHSHYPRIGESDAHLRLRRAYHQKDKGKITDQEFLNIEDSYVQDIILEQESAGLDVVTDGLIRWRDSISHVLQNWKGVHINGLLRFFDTNFYFRQPIVVDDVKIQDGWLQREVQYLVSHTSKRAKFVLTGPVTLASLSKIQASQYKDGDFCEEIARNLLSRIDSLLSLGVSQIQIDEPYIVKDQSLLPVLKGFLGDIRKSYHDRAHVILSVHTGDIASVYSDLQDMPVDSLLLDFTYSAKLPEIIERDGSAKSLGLGLLDGRNTKLENKEDIFPILEKLLPRLPSRGNFLSTSTGLEYLPRDRAYNKIERLASLVAEWNNES
ncbi:MAG: hypothetical protein HYS98_04300 [Deltaproteobacteria bacterium]|nr:hypothetical protein [Deltaproteobacteria bacterium]